ncbi:hypothetical protein [Caballeronia sp. INDeC2]|uniref:hypothetical protein n=1 Tax=Caballeronia sp. INDeC2 TaxID=2921747 RepID=UPI00202977AA|nr:hypothetical protein [Caballeronia sp. INDeC2]
MTAYGNTRTPKGAPLTAEDKKAIRNDPIAFAAAGRRIGSQAVYLPYCRNGFQYVPIEGRPDLAARLRPDLYRHLGELGYRATRWYLVDGEVRIVKAGDPDEADTLFSVVAILYGFKDGDRYRFRDGNPLNLCRGNLSFYKTPTSGESAKPRPQRRKVTAAAEQAAWDAWRDQQAAQATKRDADRAAGIKPRRKTLAELQTQREAELASIPKTGKATGMLARFEARQSL